jgi:hypothetical protein
MLGLTAGGPDEHALARSDHVNGFLGGSKLGPVSLLKGVISHLELSFSTINPAEDTH